MLVWNHEPWRDELQAWSIARASRTPLDIFANTRLEGRPPGWQLVLWPFAQVFASPRALQLVAFAIGSLAAWLWLRTVAIDWRLKASLLFGFHFTGGYLVHARDYVLSFLLLIAAIAVYSQKGVGWRLAVVLCFLSFVNAFSLAMSAALVAATWLSELLVWRQVDLRRKINLLGSFSLITLWCAWAAYLTYPTDDNQFSVGNYKGFGQALTKSFITLNYEFGWLLRIDDFLAGALLVAVLCFAWSHSQVAFSFAVLSFAMLLYNLTYGYGDYWWHFGNSMLIVFAIPCFPRRRSSPICINESYTTAPDNSFQRVSRIVSTIGTAGILIIAVISMATTRYGAGRNVHSTRPYSMTLVAAEQLRDICSNCTIIVDWDGIGAGISAQLGGREIFYLNRAEFGTFAKFSDKNIAPTWEDGLAAIERFDSPILIQTIFMTGPAPSSLELIGVHTDGVNDHNLIWQSATKRIIPDN